MRKLSTLIIIALTITGLKAQNSINDFDIGLYYELTNSTTQAVINVSGGHSITSNRVDTLYRRICKINKYNIENISEINIIAGTKKDSSDIFSHTFIFNDSIGLPAGLTYNTEGNTINLGLFETLRTDMYFYKVKLKDINGIESNPKYFY